MFGVFYARKRESIQWYLEASGMHTFPYCDFWYYSLSNYWPVSFDSELLVTSTKTSTYICTLKTQSN